MPRVLIAGCGYVGTATADLFQAAGWEVEGWTRSPESAAQLAAKPYAVHAIDIANRSAVQAAASAFDVVIHCASSGGGGTESYHRVYLEGANNLLAGLQPRRFIYTSSTSVYAQTKGEWVDEESATEPVHETGKILRKAEEFVRQNGGLVARLAGIYGPGRSALLRKFLSGEARIDNDGQRYLNQVHRDDVAAALLHLVDVIHRTLVRSVSCERDGRSTDYPARSVRVAGEKIGSSTSRSRRPAERTKTRREQQTGVEPEAARARMGAKISDLSDRNGEVGPARISGARRLTLGHGNATFAMEVQRFSKRLV